MSNASGVVALARHQLQGPAHCATEERMLRGIFVKEAPGGGETTFWISSPPRRRLVDHDEQDLPLNRPSKTEPGSWPVPSPLVCPRLTAAGLGGGCR